MIAHIDQRIIVLVVIFVDGAHLGMKDENMQVTFWDYCIRYLLRTRKCAIFL